MLQQIKQLLANADVRDAVRAAPGRDAAVNTLIDAGARRGFSFSADAVKSVLDSLNPVRTRALSESELLMVSGGRMSESAPKLCHTDSCGGNHAGCCSN